MLHSLFGDFPVNGHLFHAAIQFAEPEVGSSHGGIPSLPTALIRGLLGRGSGFFFGEAGNNSNHEPQFNERLPFYRHTNAMNASNPAAIR